MKNLLSIILVLFVAMQAQAQINEKLLQMEQKLTDGTLSEAEMYVQYGDLMFEYYGIDIAKTQHYFNEAIAFAKKNKNVESEARILTDMGYIHFMLKNNDSVLFFLDKSLKLLEGKEFYNEECANYEVRGMYFSRLYDHENAINAYLKALEACEKDKEQRVRNKQPIDRCLISKVKVLSNIGDIYSQTFNYEKTIEYYLETIKVMDDNPNVDFGRLQYQLRGALGGHYMYAKQYDKALPLLENAYKLTKAKEDNSALVYALGRLSKYYRDVKNFPKALQYAKEAIEIAEKTKLPRLIDNAERSLIKVYGEMKDYKTALYYAERLLPRIEDSNLGALREMYRNMGMFYAGVGNIDKSAEFFDKYDDVISKMSDANLQNALQEAKVKYEVEQKEQEHQAEISRHKTRQAIFIGGLLMAALLLTLLIYLLRLRNRRNSELAEMNATKDKFFNIISHDLKNPAIAQRNALQLLLSNSENWNTELLTKYYSELLKSADSQVALLYNLLNWAQVQTGRMPYLPAPFDLIDALQTDIVIIQNMAEQKGITFNIDIPQKAIVTGDDNMLTIVIRNLLTNAVKFTNAGGSVSLNISQNCISISDTGIGMTEEQQQNLFHIDKKRSRLGTSGEQGSGLGLIVCKELVEKHGSTLHIESVEGKGSKFWFEISP